MEPYSPHSWGDKPYHSLNYYLKQTFGEKIYKLALDGAMTCPNRDGTLGTGGCIFCSGGGSGDFAEPQHASVTEQIEAAKARVSAKIKNGRYIAYFQSYTNTYAPVDYLEALFREAVSHPDIAALSIGTRPDCLPPQVIRLLKEINKEKPVWIELGLQTIHASTAELILETIRFLANHTPPVDGIKLQLLHVLKGTKLAALYEAAPFPVMTMEEYIDLILKCIRLLPPHIVIHRLSGDGPKKLLIAPEWSGNKRLFLNSLTRALRETGAYQGEWHRPRQP